MLFAFSRFAESDSRPHNRFVCHKEFSCALLCVATHAVERAKIARRAALARPLVSHFAELIFKFIAAGGIRGR